MSVLNNEIGSYAMLLCLEPMARRNVFIAHSIMAGKIANCTRRKI